MDRDFLIDLFADFGPVTIRKMFSGFGISADGINFALALRAGLYFRADEQTIPQFEAEGSAPFQYQTRTKIVTVNSYWQLPARLFDEFRGIGGLGAVSAGRCAARGVAQAAEDAQSREAESRGQGCEESCEKEKAASEEEKILILRSAERASRRMAASEITGSWFETAWSLSSGRAARGPVGASSP